MFTRFRTVAVGASAAAGAAAASLFSGPADAEGQVHTCERTPFFSIEENPRSFHQLLLLFLGDKRTFTRAIQKGSPTHHPHLHLILSVHTEPLLSFFRC